MKKGLSILLVAAAIFGFYGSAVNVNDILACKDYWEEAGEKSTADMNKLEDGLNQLKDNEQAYLDGLDQVAEGEKALAQGEADYAAGQAELAKGEADYAAAPGKLADARKQIAQGEDDLAEGKSQLDGLTTLINYLNDVQSTYNKWKPKYQKAANDRKTVADTVADYKDVLKSYENFISGATEEETATLRATFDGYVDMLAANDVSSAGKKNNATEGYIMYINLAAGIYGNCTKIKDGINEAADDLADLKDGFEDCEDATYAEANNGYNPDKVKAFAEENEDLLKKYNVSNDYIALLKQGSGQVAAGVYNLISSNASTYAGYKTQVNQLATAASPALTAMAGYVGNYGTATGNEQVPYDSSKMRELAGADGGQGYMAAVCQGVASNVLGNKTLKDAVKDNLGDQGIALLTALAKTQMLFPYVEGTYDSGVEFSTFIYEMETKPAILAQLNKAKQLLAKAREEGQKTYDAGVKKLNAGKKQYAQGLADYKAAPGKLADGRQQLAEGLQALMDGRAQLAAGKDQLAQYEDGEQQVRDGLATLVGTEADLDLESILDRLNGDSDFDNGDNHLELDEGLAAVEVGRGYQAEDGELITAEIMTRAIGTAGLLAAGVLAVIAAILSFLKKNKGAGVFAILAAAAGAFGAYEATQAGTYFSSIAGSTVGQSGMIAAGILGCVALVHAIVHFTAKKEA